MRKLWLSKEDFELFHHEIGPFDFEFFRTHMDAFKRMWREQSSRFWVVFIDVYEEYVWTHGSLKDFPTSISGEDVRGTVGTLFDQIRDHFVKGKVSTAKNYILNAALVAQNKHAVSVMDKVNTKQNPFYIKETREAFRTFFGEPSDKDTYIRLILGLPIFLKFAGAAIVALKRWLHAEEVDEDSEVEIDKYFSTIHSPPYMPRVEPFAYLPLTIEKRTFPTTTKTKSSSSTVKKTETVTFPSDSPSPTPDTGAASNDLPESKPAAVEPSIPITEPSPRETEVATVMDEEEEAKKKVKLHNCAFCHKEEQTAKSFKRCQKCKGKPSPSYYCCKDCQAKDWKAGHRDEHKSD